MDPARMHERSVELLNGPVGRRYGLYIMLLSFTTAFTGNGLLAMVGMLTGLMLCNGSRGAGPLVPLSALTTILAIFQLIVVLGMFLSVLSNTPSSFCARTKTLLEYATGEPVQRAPSYSTYHSGYATSTYHGNGGYATASPTYYGVIEADEAVKDAERRQLVESPPGPPPPGYLSCDPQSSGYSSCISQARMVQYAQSMNQMACGPKSGLILMSAAMALLLYGMLVLTPLAVLSSRAGALARGAGGCDDGWGPPLQTIVITGSRPFGRDVFGNAAVGVPVRVGTLPGRPVVAGSGPVSGVSMH